MNNGNKVSLGLALLIGASLGCCSLPLSSTGMLTVSVTDQKAQPITTDASAVFLDRDGAPIVSIISGARGSWQNTLLWFSHSTNPDSLKRPEDTLKATAVRIAAENCDPATVPVAVTRTYEPLSFSPHGGGPASYIYRFEQTIALQCR